MREKDLLAQEEDVGVGEVQVCAGLQDQGAEEGHRAQGVGDYEPQGWDKLNG